MLAEILILLLLFTALIFVHFKYFTNNHIMNKFLEILDALLSVFIPYKDAIMGGVVWFLYSHLYLKREKLSNFLEFIMGVIFSVYASPQIILYFQFLNFSFVSFTCGLMGMTVMRLALEFPWKDVSTKLVTELLSAFINKIKKP
jgi:hypothetical protein